MVQAKSIKLESVTSSQIEKLGYTDGILIVEFKGGARYIYCGVDSYTYDSLVNATSVGSFFSNHIKNDENIKCIKLP